MSTESTIRSGQFINWVVMPRRRLGGEPAGPDSYGPPGVTAYFAPISLELAMAPAVARLRFAIVPDELEMPWRWGKVIALDDMVELMGDQASGRVGLFSGFVVEPDWQYQASGGSCVVVAMGRAQRLLADVPVYGRYMYAADNTVFHATGLPCEFNADGRPNRSDKTTTPRFTYDGDPAAVYWSATDAMRYLTEHYNEDGTWLANPVFTPAQQADISPITAPAEGLSLWEALAKVADAGGYDVFEQYAWSGDKMTAAIKYQKRGAGPAYEIRHQVTAAVKPAVTLAGTNSFSARVAATVASCITAPVVLGARTLTELSVWLFPTWLPLAIPYDAPTDGPMILENDTETNYKRRYVLGGGLDLDMDVLQKGLGRRWDANTDRLYTAANHGEFIGLGVDMGLQVEDKAGTWPLMPHRPLPLITRKQHGADVVAYWSPDGGANHYKLRGFRVEPDRLGIYITQPNLADISYGDKADKATKNFFAALVANYTNVRVYLRCTVASPIRSLHIAARRSSAGTLFSTARALDRGQTGGVRTIKPNTNSPWYAYTSGEAGTDDSDNLRLIAQAVQDAAEDRFIEGTLELPWPETAISLGDRVERIKGIDYKLGVNGGAALRYPRVVRLILNLTPDSYDTQICLDTDRQAGVV